VTGHVGTSTSIPLEGAAAESHSLFWLAPIVPSDATSESSSLSSPPPLRKRIKTDKNAEPSAKKRPPRQRKSNSAVDDGNFDLSSSPAAGKTPRSKRKKPLGDEEIVSVKELQDDSMDTEKPKSKRRKPSGEVASSIPRSGPVRRSRGSTVVRNSAPVEISSSTNHLSKRGKTANDKAELEQVEEAKGDEVAAALAFATAEDEVEEQEEDEQEEDEQEEDE
jgi:hypothetical protein